MGSMTPHPSCPACVAHRLHSAEERKSFHPWAGHGRNGNQQCDCGREAMKDVNESLRERQQKATFHCYFWLQKLMATGRYQNYSPPSPMKSWGPISEYQLRAVIDAKTISESYLLPTHAERIAAFRPPPLEVPPGTLSGGLNGRLCYSKEMIEAVHEELNPATESADWEGRIYPDFIIRDFLKDLLELRSLLWAFKHSEALAVVLKSPQILTAYPVAYAQGRGA
jgi:hypothetical protein